jgi:hypothetical protein
MDASEITPENVRKVWTEDIGYCARSDSQNERIRKIMHKYNTLRLSDIVTLPETTKNAEMVDYLDNYLVLGIEQEITLFERVYDEISELPVDEIEEFAAALTIMQGIISDWRPVAAHPDIVAWMNKEFTAIYDL